MWQTTKVKDIWKIIRNVELAKQKYTTLIVENLEEFNQLFGNWGSYSSCIMLQYDPFYGFAKLTR